MIPGTKLCPVLAPVYLELTRYRLPIRHESEMQLAIAGILAKDVVGQWLREFDLGDAGRIDHYSPVLRIGVECKVDGSPSGVAEQLLRYADHDAIDGLIVVSAKPSHARKIPALLRGKPVMVVRAWANVF